jgi:hypothetical protein
MLSKWSLLPRCYFRITKTPSLTLRSRIYQRAMTIHADVIQDWKRKQTEAQDRITGLLRSLNYVSDRDKRASIGRQVETHRGEQEMYERLLQAQLRSVSQSSADGTHR